jgi:O-antigen/teichoic acid export membrane protein
MTLLKRNVIANFAGTAWSALVSILFVPLYIKYLGIEAYGLMGIYGALQATVALLDVGLSPTMNRELARRSVQPDNAQEMRDFVHTLEIVYWGIAAIIGAGTLALAPVIAHDWVKPGVLSTDTVQQALIIMSLIMTLQWPISFYSGGLLGLQRQVALNAVNVLIATLRGVGAIVILWLVSPTVQAFFIWQAITSALQTFLIAYLVWRRIPETDRPPAFKLQLLKSIWRFAAGISGITVVVTILTLLDKVILSKILTLEAFGYYTLAAAVASNLGRPAGPVSTAIFPRFTQLISQRDQDGLKELYHNGCQLMSVVILPMAAVATLFAPHILLLWTGDPVTTDRVQLLLSILVVGTALNCMMNLPYSLQLAYGWTKLSFYNNLIAVVVLAPVILWSSINYGALGASIVWAVLNASYILITIPIMHRRLLPHEKWRWYLQDVGAPALASWSVVFLLRLLLPAGATPLIVILWLAISTGLATLVAAMVTPYTRQWALRFVPLIIKKAA